MRLKSRNNTWVVQVAIVVYILLAFGTIQVAAQGGSTGGIANLVEVTSQFTNTVNIFNFLILAVVLGPALTLLVIFRMNKLDREEQADTRALHHQESVAIQQIMNQSLSVFLQTVNSLVVMKAEFSTEMKNALALLKESADIVRRSNETMMRTEANFRFHVTAINDKIELSLNNTTKTLQQALQNTMSDTIKTFEAAAKKEEPKTGDTV